LNVNAVKLLLHQVCLIAMKAKIGTVSLKEDNDVKFEQCTCDELNELKDAFDTVIILE